MNRSSYNKVKRCPTTVTTDCVEYVGESIPCLDICKGDFLTDVEFNIATKVCELASLTDTSNIQLPDCFVAAWGTKDKTILEFLSFLLDQACLQKDSIESIETQLVKLDPLVTVDYKCCSDNPCVTIGEVKLSVALQNIISCICSLKEVVGTLPAGKTSVVGYIQDLEARVELQTAIINHITEQYESIVTSLTTISSKLNTHKDTINCIISDLDDNGLNTNSCTEIS